MQWHRDGYVLDDDRARLDMPRMVAWIQASFPPRCAATVAG